MAWFSHVLIQLNGRMKTNGALLILTMTMTLFSVLACTNSANKEDNNINNNPALDTVDIKEDTTNNFPIPLPDSTIHVSDSIAKL
ncbi:MAG: hypothetical protein V4717_24070 [Bacteroidota bacterium]